MGVVVGVGTAAEEGGGKGGEGSPVVGWVDAWMRQGCSAIDFASFTTGAVVAPISRAAHASLSAEG